MKMATAHVSTTPILSQWSIEPAYTSTSLTEGPSTSVINEASDLELEKSREDALELESVETFMNSTCGCRMGLYPFDERNNSEAESLHFRDEFDLAIVAQLRAYHAVLDQSSLHRTHHKEQNSAWQRITHMVYELSKKVCFCTTSN